MRKIQYRDIVKNAFLITWENKFLWFFGFLILLGSIGSNLNFNDRQGEKNQAVASFIQDNPTLFSILVAVLILIIVILFLLRIMAVVSIIKSVNDIKLYKQLPITSIFKESKNYLGKLIWLEIIVGLALLVVGFLLAIPVLYLFALKAKMLAYSALSLALVIALPLMLLAYYLIKYASFHIILINEKLMLSLESAYALFVKNMKESLFMGMVIMALNILLILVILLIFVFVAVVFAPIGFIAYLMFTKMAATVVLIIAALFYVAVVGVFFSWYESFLQTCWLLFFRQIAFEKHRDSKLSAELEVEVKIGSPESV